MKEVRGRNGGKLLVREKGDPAPEGAGRPKGSKSFSTLLANALDKAVGKDEATGNEISAKEAAVYRLIKMLLSDQTDDNTTLKAFALIRDTIGEAPVEKKELSGPDGEAINPVFILEIPADVSSAGTDKV